MLVGLTTHADGSPVCSSVVCLFLLSRTDAARITTLDVEMFHYESRKPVYFEDRKLRANATSHKNSAGVDLSTLVSAGFFVFQSVPCVCVILHEIPSSPQLLWQLSLQLLPRRLRLQRL